MCILENEECPLTDIYVVDGSYKLKAYEEYIQFTYDTANKIVYTRKGDNFPIVDIQVQVGDIGCREYNKLPWRYNKSNYVLLNQQYNGCGVYG